MGVEELNCVNCFYVYTTIGQLPLEDQEYLKCARNPEHIVISYKPENEYDFPHRHHFCGEFESRSKKLV